MHQNKTLPIGQCSRIRKLFRSMQLEKGRLEDERDLIGPRMDEIQNQFLRARNAQERARLQDRAGILERDFNQIKLRIERLDRRLDEVHNDYVITGCDALFGPL